MEREIKRKFILNRQEIEGAIFDWLKKNDLPQPMKASDMSVCHQEMYLDDVDVSWDTNDVITFDQKPN